MSKKLFLVDLDLNGNQLTHAIIEKLPYPPDAEEGRIYYDTTEHLFKYFNGNDWISQKEVRNTKNEDTNQIAIFDSSTSTVIKFRVLKGDDYIKLSNSGGVVNLTFQSGYIRFEGGSGSNSAKLKGSNTEATNTSEVAIGKWNKSNSGTLFSVGNGTGSSDRSNAFEVKANGDVILDGIEGDVQSVILDSNRKVNAIVANLMDLEVTTNQSLWWDQPGQKTIQGVNIPYSVKMNSYDGSVITHHDELVVKLTTQAGISEVRYLYDSNTGLYHSPNSYVFLNNTDFRIELEWHVTDESVEKVAKTYLYGLRAPKYYGRTSKTKDTITASDISALTNESTYSWNNLKSKSGLNIPSTSDNKLYYVYAYPSSWGALNTISNALGTYYTPETDAAGTSTFTRRTMMVHSIEYYVYIYRDFNGSSASNLIFN